MADNINEQGKIKRPVVLTIFCILGFLGLAFGFISIFLVPDVVSQLTSRSSLYLPITIILSLSMIVSLVGYWKMRKWGVYLYSVATGINIVYGLSINTPIYNSLFPVIITILGWIYLKRMT